MEVNLQHSQGRLMNLEENNSLKTAYSNKDDFIKKNYQEIHWNHAKLV